MQPLLISPSLILVAISCCGCGHSLAVNPYHSSAGISSDFRQRAVDANRRGLALVEQDNLQEAEAAFREAVHADGRYAAAHNNLAIALMHRCRYHAAAVHFDAASKLEPDAIEPLVNLGDLYTTVGWLKEAANLYEEALQLDDGNIEVIGRLAHVYLEVGKEPRVLGQLPGQLAAGPGDQEWKSWAKTRICDLADTSE